MCCSTVRRAAASVVIGLSLAPRAGAQILDVFWVPVAGQPGMPYPENATSGPGGDPQLLNMQTWDVGIYNDGDWSSAGMQLILPPGNTFYNPAFGGNTKPNPAIVNAFPAVAFDTYVTSPTDNGTSGQPGVAGFYPPAPGPGDFGGTSGVFSVSWFNPVNDPPGTSQIARITFPRNVWPDFSPFGETAQLNPDLTRPIEPMDYPTTNRWLPDADGSWHDPANWSQGREPGVNNMFPLLDVGGATVRTITHSQGRTAVHGITSQEHIVLSGGTISTINGLRIFNGLTLDGGTLRGGVAHSAVRVGAAGGRLEEASLSDGLIHPTLATVVVTDGLSLGGTSTFNPGARMRFEGSPIALRGNGTVHHGGGVIDVAGGATLTLSDSLLIRKTAGQALRINGSLALVVTATIDVVDGAVVIDYAGPSPLDHIRSKIVSGYANDTWTGTGINSSTAAAEDDLAVSYAEASAIFTSFPADFLGESIDATTLLVRLVRNGDADLNGVVNLADFNRLAANFGSTAALWDDGDFTYDGTVNLSDFNLLAANFGQSAGGSSLTPADWAALASAVPEPGGIGIMMGLLCPASCRGRHRRRTRCVRV